MVMDSILTPKTRYNGFVSQLSQFTDCITIILPLDTEESVQLIETIDSVVQNLPLKDDNYFFKESEVLSSSSQYPSIGPCYKSIKSTPPIRLHGVVLS
jgi:hypothetical protein